jgi:hypothetical protein
MRPLDRRSLLLGIAASAAPRLVFAQSASVPLMRFGARGDGSADDSVALIRALGSGMPLDGGGRTYGVAGPLAAQAGFRGLSNCTLRQLAREDHLRTLEIRGARGFSLAGVRIIRGEQNDDALVQADMQRNAGIWIEGCEDFQLNDVKVRGGGIGTGLVLMQCRRFRTTDLEVSAIHYRLRQRPRDDMLQGIWINRCSGFDMTRPTAFDLGGQDDQGFSRDNNRGIAISGSSDFRLRDLRVAQCGQGLDCTGKEGITNFQVIGGHASDCYTWGFKFSNTSQHLQVSHALAERCRLGGYVVSGPTVEEDPPTQDVLISDSQAIDCGVPGDDHTTMFGFGILRARTHHDYPQKVRFVRCAAIDRRRPPGMKWGFFNEIPETPGGLNVTQDCTVSGAKIADQRGFEH